MKETTGLYLNVDKEVKNKVQDFCNIVGLSISDIVNYIFHYIIDNNKLPSLYSINKITFFEDLKEEDLDLLSKLDEKQIENNNFYDLEDFIEEFNIE